MSRTAYISFYRPEDRFWAVGSGPAKKAHRAIGSWPGNNAVETACRNSICLHGEGELAHAWEPYAGMSYDFEDIPPKFVICLKCVEADETVE